MQPSVGGGNCSCLASIGALRNEKLKLQALHSNALEPPMPRQNHRGTLSWLKPCWRGPATQVPASLQSSASGVLPGTHVCCAHARITATFPGAVAEDALTSTFACSTSALLSAACAHGTAWIDGSTPAVATSLARPLRGSQLRRGAWPLSHHFACSSAEYMLL